jgi:hypothetical protein
MYGASALTAATVVSSLIWIVGRVRSEVQGPIAAMSARLELAEERPGLPPVAVI